MKPLLVVDRDIPFAEEILSGLGEMRSVPGHQIGPDTVQDADAIVVRSITRVDASLLEGSSVRFVGTATAGIDHIDRAWLDTAGVAWASAPGANAQSVVEYALAAMTVIASRREVSWANRTLGVVGCGEVGQRLADRAALVGMRVLRNDPPRAEREGADGFVPLTYLLGQSDIVSVHVPLELDGAHPTRNLIDVEGLALMKPGAWLIQSSRGGTVEEAAAVRARSSGHLGALVLDVFENEPDPAAAAIDAADIATGHIAGYSRDAKRNGVLMIRDALQRHFGVQDTGERAERVEPHFLRLPSPKQGTLPDPDGTAWMDPLMSQVMDLRGDDARFRRVMREAENRALAFHTYRASYPARYGWSRYGAVPRSRAEQEMLKALGFRCLPKPDQPLEDQVV